MSQEPTQGPERKSERKAGIYCFMDVVAKEAEEYAADHTSPMSPLLEEIEHFTLTKTPYPSMLTGRVEGRFLQLIGGSTLRSTAYRRYRHFHRLLSLGHG
jgi:hypothetical protein